MIFVWCGILGFGLMRGFELELFVGVSGEVDVGRGHNGFFMLI